MNENKHDDGMAGSFAPVIGFAIGALVGGGIALLLAPASGARTRRRIGVTARRWSRDARDTFDEARDNVTEAASSLEEGVRSAVEAGKDAFRHDGVAQSSPRVDPILGPSSRRRL
jgi:gas vesicle protein